MNLASMDLTDMSNVINGGSDVGGLVTGYHDMTGNSRLHAIVGLDANAEDITVTAQQATADDGTDTKALEIGHANIKFGTDINYSRIAGGASVVADADTAGVLVAEFALANLDINNGFRYVQITLAGSTARSQNVVLLPMGGRVIT